MLGELRRSGVRRPGLWTALSQFYFKNQEGEAGSRTNKSVTESGPIPHSLTCLLKVVILKASVCARCFIKEDAIDLEFRVVGRLWPRRICIDFLKHIVERFCGVIRRYISKGAYVLVSPQLRDCTQIVLIGE